MAEVRRLMPRKWVTTIAVVATLIATGILVSITPYRLKEEDNGVSVQESAARASRR